MSNQRNIRRRAFLALAGFINRRSGWIVGVAVLLAGASAVYSALEIEFITERNALVSPDSEFNRRFLKYRQAMGDQETMLVVITPAPGPVDNPEFDPRPADEKTRAEMKAAASAIATKLRERPELFEFVYDRAPSEDFQGTGMLYLPLSELQTVEQQVTPSRPMLRELAANPGYAGLLTGVRAGLDEGALGSDDPDAIADAAKGLTGLLAGVRKALDTGETDAMNLGATDETFDPDGHFFLWDGRAVLVSAIPIQKHGELDRVAEPLAYAREVVADVQDEHPDLAIGLTGRPTIYSDEMATSSRDMTRATIFALIAVGLLFVLAFRSVTRPLLSVLSLVLALAWTFGATTLFIGHLNIFAMVFTVILVGLGIDFGVHLLSHFIEARRDGLTVKRSLARVYAEIGSGTVVGAVTTGAALVSSAATDFRGLAELGVICGMGILFCLIAMLVVFPAMLRLLDRKPTQNGKRKPPAPIGRAGKAAGVAVMLGALACATFVGVGFASGWKPFSYNMLDLNDPSSDSAQWEEMLIKHDPRSSFAVCLRESSEELRALEQRIDREADPTIVRRSESLFPKDEAAKRASLARIHQALPTTIPTLPETRTTPKQLRSSARKVQSGLKALRARGDEYATLFAPALDEATAIVELTRRRDAQAKIDATEPALFGPLLDGLRTLRDNSAPPKVTPATVPEALRRRYVGDIDGQAVFALYVYPQKDVWAHEASGEFNNEVARFDPEVTGVTVQVHESGNLIYEGFLLSTALAAVVIVLLLLIDLRNPVRVLVALTPLLCALAYLLAVMRVTGLEFNFANFFGVPILIGTMVDAGVYLVHSQRHGNPVRTVAHTRRACLLCGATTFLGFGSLIIANHQGIQSLGWILAIGCAFGVLGSWFATPTILSWFTARNRRI